MHALEMPDAFAGFCVKRNQRVSKQVVAYAIAAIKVEHRGTGGNIDDAALGIDRHPGPIVGGSGIFPGVFRPGVITELSRPWDRVEGPAQSSGAYIEGADVSGRRWMGFRACPTNDDDILINAARCS